MSKQSNQQQAWKCSFSATFENNKKHTTLFSKFLIKKILNANFCIYSKRQAFSFPFTKKICHQTFNGLNNYHLIRAMLANPLIFLYLTEGNAFRLIMFTKTCVLFKAVNAFMIIRYVPTHRTQGSKQYRVITNTKNFEKIFSWIFRLLSASTVVVRAFSLNKYRYNESKDPARP